MTAAWAWAIGLLAAGAGSAALAGSQYRNRLDKWEVQFPNEDFNRLIGDIASIEGLLFDRTG